MPQKRMAARGPAAKIPASKKAPVTKIAGAKSKAKAKGKSTKASPEIEKAKTALTKAASKAAAVEPKAVAAKPRARKISMDISPNEAASALSGKWNTLFKKSEQIEAKPYNMKASFEEKTAIVHKVLGWGYILANRNDRLEVLFKDGIKYLISNYKP